MLGSTVAVADAGKVKVYTKNFGEFYNDQIETAGAIVLSRTDSIPQSKLDSAIELLRQYNHNASLVTTPWNQLSGFQLLDAIEGKSSLATELEKLEKEHLHNHDEAEHHCCCGHHHEEHNHHDEQHHCCGHHHEEHHHHDGEHHCCGHDHGEHHHHDADEVFTSWGVETTRKFTAEEIQSALKELDSGKYGIVLRAKGILPANTENWIHFDYVPEEYDVRFGTAGVIGKLCVIGSNLNEAGIAAVFGV